MVTVSNIGDFFPTLVRWSRTLTVGEGSLLASFIIGADGYEIIINVGVFRRGVSRDAFPLTPFPDVDMISRPECVSLLSSYDVELNKL